MLAVSTVTSYLIPRPLTDVFYNGYRVYSSYRVNKIPHVEKMVKAILRIVLAVPFALAVWQMSHIKICLLGRSILILTYFGMGILIGNPSCTLAFASLHIITYLQRCAKVYSDPARRTDLVLYSAITLGYYFCIQNYDRITLGILDHRIQSKARKVANEWFRRS